MIALHIYWLDTSKMSLLSYNLNILLFPLLISLFSWQFINENGLEHYPHESRGIILQILSEICG